MSDRQTFKDRRIADKYFDRRSGIDRRRGFDIGHFAQDLIERRKGMERRQKDERRDQYFRIDEWSSICVTPKSACE